jgi:hypothetical protein
LAATRADVAVALRMDTALVVLGECWREVEVARDESASERHESGRAGDGDGIRMHTYSHSKSRPEQESRRERVRQGHEGHRQTGGFFPLDAPLRSMRWSHAAYSRTDTYRSSGMRHVDEQRPCMYRKSRATLCAVILWFIIKSAINVSI